MKRDLLVFHSAFKKGGGGKLMTGWGCPYKHTLSGNGRADSEKGVDGGKRENGLRVAGLIEPKKIR